MQAEDEILSRISDDRFVTVPISSIWMGTAPLSSTGWIEDRDPLAARLSIIVIVDHGGLFLHLSISRGRERRSTPAPVPVHEERGWRPMGSSLSIYPP